VYRATGILSLEGLKNIEVFSTSPGLFDECLSIEAPSSFQGQYCSAFFQGRKWTSLAFCSPIFQFLSKELVDSSPLLTKFFQGYINTDYFHFIILMPHLIWSSGYNGAKMCTKPSITKPGLVHHSILLV